MSDPRALYKALVLEHSRSPKNEGLLDGATHQARGTNPLCGDRVDVQVELRDGRIQAVRFLARGCAIAKASASIMTTLVQGEMAADATALGARLDALLASASSEAEPRLDPLLGVRQFPGRTRCATLPWTTLAQALASKTDAE